MIEHQEIVQLDYQIDLRRKGRMYQVLAGGLETQIEYNFSLMNTHRNDFKAFDLETQRMVYCVINKEFENIFF
jgi:hypothetical protein